jgi:hypothetical protein
MIRRWSAAAAPHADEAGRANTDRPELSMIVRCRSAKSAHVENARDLRLVGVARGQGKGKARQGKAVDVTATSTKPRIDLCLCRLASCPS